MHTALQAEQVQMESAVCRARCRARKGGCSAGLTAAASSRSPSVTLRDARSVQAVGRLQAADLLPVLFSNSEKFSSRRDLARSLSQELPGEDRRAVHFPNAAL